MKDEYKDLKEIDETLLYLRKYRSFLKFELVELDRTIDMLSRYKNEEEINNQIFKYINMPLVTSDDFIKSAMKYLQY